MKRKKTTPLLSGAAERLGTGSNDETSCEHSLKSPNACVTLTVSDLALRTSVSVNGVRHPYSIGYFMPN